MELRQLEYFVAVAEQMHFGRADLTDYHGGPRCARQRPPLLVLTATTS